MPTAKLILLLLPLRLRPPTCQRVIFYQVVEECAQKQRRRTYGWLEQASQATMADGGPREDEAERVLQVVADAMILYLETNGSRNGEWAQLERPRFMFDGGKSD